MTHSFFGEFLLFRPPLSPQDCESSPLSGTHTPHFLSRCSCFLSETGCWVLDSSTFRKLRPVLCQGTVLNSWNFSGFWRYVYRTCLRLNHSCCVLLSDEFENMTLSFIHTEKLPDTSEQCEGREMVAVWQKVKKSEQVIKLFVLYLGQTVSG